jgi:allophanate hydrolase subunit 2
MGLRLEGHSISATIVAERLSTPVCPGAIQLAGGQLIILGIACGTMGGYPLIAHAISADLDRLAQLRPGDQIGFERVTIDQARDRDRESRRRLARDLAGILLAAIDKIGASK